MLPNHPPDPSISRHPLPPTAHDLATVCVLCSHNCGLLVDVEEGQITNIRPDKSSLTGGYICNKATSIPWVVHHGQRLEHPLRRRPDGTFQRISWEEAIGEIAQRLGELRARYGPQAMGLVGGGGQANHLGGGYALSLLAALGSRRWFSSYAQEKTQHHLVDQWMFDAPPATSFHPDVEDAPLLITLGTNPRISNRGANANITFNELRRAQGRRLIAVDPRHTETSAGADRHLRIRPGTDAFLLLALAKILLEEDLVDGDFLEARTRDLDQVKQALGPVDPADLARRCRLSLDEVRQTARELAAAPAASIMYDLAVEHTWFSTLVSYLIRLVLVLTGNVGRPGSNHFLESFTPPVRSKNRFREPPRSVVAGIPAIRALGNAAMFSPSLVPEEVLTEDPARLRALLVENSNPWLAYADTPRWRQARQALDLLVVVEPTMTETAEEADYVLPAPVGYEKWEWAGFPKGRFPQIGTQLRPPILPAPPEALPEPEIYARLAEALELFPPPPRELFDLAPEALTDDGVEAYVEALFRTSRAAAKAAQPCALFWAYRTLGPQLPGPAPAALFLRCLDNALSRRASVVRALGPEWQEASPPRIALALFRRMLDHPEGTIIAVAERERNLEDNLGWEDGRIRLAPEPMLAEIQRALDFELDSDPDYPLILASGLRTRWTANAIQRDPRWRKGKGPHCTLHLAPEDAARLGIADRRPVRLSTRRGSVELPAEIDPKVQPGHVWMPNGFGVVYPDPETGEPIMQGVNLNEITDAQDRDPITACPHHKVIPCRVEAV